MFCGKCGNELTSNKLPCDKCGFYNEVVTNNKAVNIKKYIFLGIILISIAVGIIFFLIINNSVEHRLNKKLNQANKHYTNMDYELAIESYEEAINIDPKSEDAYLGLANVYVTIAENYQESGLFDDSMTNFENAIICYEEIFKFNETSFDAFISESDTYIAMANCLIEKGDFSEDDYNDALQYYDKAYELLNVNKDNNQIQEKLVEIENKLSDIEVKLNNYNAEIERLKHEEFINSITIYDAVNIGSYAYDKSISHGECVFSVDDINEADKLLRLTVITFDEVSNGRYVLYDGELVVSIERDDEKECYKTEAFRLPTPNSYWTKYIWIEFYYDGTVRECYCPSYVLDENECFKVKGLKYHISKYLNLNEHKDDSNNQSMEESRTDSFYGIWIYASKDEEEANKISNSITATGLCKGEVFISNEWSNLNSEKWFVVTAGIYEDKESAEQILESIKQAGYANAYIKYSGEHL